MITKEQIKELYVTQRKRRHEIAEELGIKPYQVQYLTAKFGLTRPRLERTRPKSCYSFDELFFKTIDSEDKAYWLGFIAADGCVIDTKGKRCLQIELSSKDRGHLEKLKSAIKYDGPIHYNRKHYLTHNGKTDVFLCDLLQINHTGLVRDLISHGITPRKSKTLQPPKIRKKLVRHWIRGYFDGDGSVSIDKQGNIRGEVFSGSKSVISFIGSYILPDAKIQEKISGCTIGFGGNNVAKRIEKFLYKNAIAFLDRKHAIFMGGVS